MLSPTNNLYKNCICGQNYIVIKNFYFDYRFEISHKIEVSNLVIKRGDMYYADLSPVIGSEQGGVRPVLIIQNDVGNKYSPTVIVSAITSQINKAKIPPHIELSASEFGLPKDSVVLLEQLRTIDKRRLKEKIGEIDSVKMNKVDNALLISLGFI